MNPRELLKNKIAVMKAMLDAAKTANRNFTADEETIFAAHEAERDQLVARIAEEDKQAKREADMVALNAQMSAPVNPLPRSNIEGGEDRAASRPWARFGEQMLAVRAAAAPGGTIDPRLTVKNAATGLNEGVTSDGGFLVQQDFTTELLKRAYDTGVLASRVRKIPISSGANGIKINGIDESSRANGSRMGGIQAYWENEADAYVGSKPKFRKIELNLKKLIGLCYATDELLEDASALESILTDGFAEEFGFKIDDAIINGVGVGQPLGILNAPSLISVAKEAGQAAGTIVVENIVKMWSRCYGRSRMNAAWFINQDIEPQLYTMSLAVGTGGVPVYMPANGLSDSPYSTLFGRPVIPLEQCQTIGTVGDIILSDFSQYIIGDKGSIKSDVSIHVRFLYDEQVFKFTYRVDGQPIWHSALTPFKGTNTLSPHVALATRA